MSVVHVKIKIDAPPERVWETVMDPNKLKEWVTIHRSVGHVPRLPLKEGASFDQGLQMRGFRFQVHWKLVEVKEPSYATWEGRGPAHSSAQISYRLESAGDNATEFDYTNEFSPPGGRIGNIASRMIVGAASEREAHNSLTRLKALLER